MIGLVRGLSLSDIVDLNKIFATSCSSRFLHVFYCFDILSRSNSLSKTTKWNQIGRLSMNAMSKSVLTEDMDSVLGFGVKKLYFRDEADKCLEIAMRAVREGNRDKAEKFVKKAEKLFPSRKIQVTIE